MFKELICPNCKGTFDVDKLKKIEAVLKKHRLLFECAQDAVLYVKEDGIVTDANEAAKKLYGYAGNEITGMSIHKIRHPSTRALFAEQMRQADETGILFESMHVRKDGYAFPVEVSARSTMIDGERVRIHIIRDISERKRTEEKIIFLANHDQLTGIPNRMYLMKTLDNALNLAERGRYNLAVMFFDIDGFKKINDMHGHQAGDEVLKEVAARIKSVIRSIDVIGRFGGDEFLVILPMVKSRHDLQELADRMFKTLDGRIYINGNSLYVTISIGIAIYPDDAKDKESLIRYADQAMYDAKRRQGNSVCFFDIENRQSEGRERMV